VLLPGLRSSENLAAFEAVKFDSEGNDMTTEQKTNYKAYRAECRLSNVEPNRADFSAGEIPACVRYQLELQKPHLAANAATA
jgi:hypothetical protein